LPVGHASPPGGRAENSPECSGAELWECIATEESAP
jgi:hypothetical protein